MSQTTTMTVRIPIEVKHRLEKLARSTDRSKAFIAGKAIENYLDAQEWQISAINAPMHPARPNTRHAHDIRPRARHLKQRPPAATGATARGESHGSRARLRADAPDGGGEEGDRASACHGRTQRPVRRALDKVGRICAKPVAQRGYLPFVETFRNLKRSPVIELETGAP